MIYKTAVAALLAAAMTVAAGSAFAQGPLSIDFSKMEAATKQALAAGNDNAAQTLAAEEALKEAKATMKEITSPAVQKVTSHLRAAVTASKAGKTAEAAEHLNSALGQMKQPAQ
jgi:hypothetical protein